MKNTLKLEIKMFDLVFRHILFEISIFEKIVKVNTFGEDANKQKCLQDFFPI